MKTSLLCIILSLTFFAYANAFAEQPDDYYEISPADQATMDHKLDSLKAIQLKDQEKMKYRIGFNLGIATPYAGLKSAIFVGQSEVFSMDYCLSNNTYIFSEFIFSAYEPDKGVVIKNAYEGKNHPYNSLVKYESQNPCRVYSYVLGFGARLGSNYAKPSLRMGLGAVYNHTTEDMFTVYNSQDTITIPKYSANSFGLNYMLGFELPFGVKQCGFFSTLNLTSAVFGTKFGLEMQFTSMGFIGIYGRF
jgi:hypothetical protein